MLFIRHKWKGARRARAVLVPRHKESFRQLAQPAQPSPVDRYFIFFQNSQPSQPSQPSPSTGIYIFFKISTSPTIPRHKEFFRQLPQQAASQTSQPSRSSQPGRPSQHSIALPHSILYFCKISLACQSDRPPAWIFFIFTKYRILHFYKIPLHRPANRGPLRTQPSPGS